MKIVSTYFGAEYSKGVEVASRCQAAGLSSRSLTYMTAKFFKDEIHPTRT